MTADRTPPHFSRDELAQRRTRTRAAMAEAGLDALLCFKQESMYWLTGYDTFGFCFFQCLVLRADGGMALLTRAPDLRQAQLTSTLEDIRIWVDRDGADPACELRAPGRAGPRRQAAGRRVGHARAHRRQRPAAGGGAGRLRHAGRCLASALPAAPGQVAGRARLSSAKRGRARRRGAGRRRRAHRAGRRRGRHPGRGCTTRSSRAAATIRATRSSSARARRPCSAATSPAAAGSTRTTS